MIKTLAKAQNLFSEKTTLNFLNPKSVTRDELYGSINVATREWMDGLISQIFRDLANCFTVKHEYIILDGDIDAEWIESMNTVTKRSKRRLVNLLFSEAILVVDKSVVESGA
jgi:dynein heavy chain, axonemal